MKRACAILLVVLAPVPGLCDAPEDAVRGVVERIEENLGTLGGNVLVVAPLTYPDGIKSIEGALVSERLLEALAEGGFVKVVERTMLDKVLDEQKLAASGLVDPATAVRVGKLLGARGMLTGTAMDQGENLEVHVRLLNIETGEVAFAMTQVMPRAIKTFMSPMWTEIDRIKKENPSFKVRFWADRGQEPTAIPRYRIGEMIELFFEAEQDCYVTIFDFTSSGSVHVLFPNAFMKDNHVKAQQVYAIPDAQAGFKIRVGDPPGIERLKLFATTREISLFREDYSQESFRSVDPGAYSVTRDLQPVIESLEGNAWAESQLELRIEQVLRQGN
jgi:hypothetical protein